MCSEYVIAITSAIIIVTITAIMKIDFIFEHTGFIKMENYCIGYFKACKTVYFNLVYSCKRCFISYFRIVTKSMLT